MPEQTALVTAVNQLNDKLEATQVSLDEINDRLDTLPDRYLPRKEAELKAGKVKKLLAGLLVGGLLVASTVGLTMYLTHQSTCAVRGVLELAKTSTARNPIPADLDPESRARVESQRAQAAAFYTDALERLPILWGC